MWEFKGTRMTKIIWKIRKKVGGFTLSDFKNLLQICYNHNTIVLTERKANRTVEWNLDSGN